MWEAINMGVDQGEVDQKVSSYNSPSKGLRDVNSDKGSEGI